MSPQDPGPSSQDVAASTPAAPSAQPRAAEAPTPVSLEQRKAEKARRRLAAGVAPPATAPTPGTPVASFALPPTAAPARARGRHWAVGASFLLLVVLPTLLVAWYLTARAAPRYASAAGFSVRTEEVSSAIELLGGMAELSGSSSSDTDILYQFIQSQEIVAKVDARLDLRTLWAKPAAEDPVFAYRPGAGLLDTVRSVGGVGSAAEEASGPGTIEDLHAQWGRMVSVYNDTATGLLAIEAQAFEPDDAQRIAEAIYEESGSLINRLSAIAQADATRFAEEELATAVERLKVARAALTRFRNETQIVDPLLSMEGQMGLLSTLEEQLATTLIDLDILRQTTADSDPRVVQAEARIAVIEARMEEERAKLGLGQATGQGSAAGDVAFADLVGEYEELMVDQEFAAEAYTAALVSYDSALAESRRQSRYLAAHVQPTLAEQAVYPNRAALTGLTALFLGLAWSIATLAAYAIRDRR